MTQPIIQEATNNKKVVQLGASASREHVDKFWAEDITSIQSPLILKSKDVQVDIKDNQHTQTSFMQQTFMRSTKQGCSGDPCLTPGCNGRKNKNKVESNASYHHMRVKITTPQNLQQDETLEEVND